VAAAPKSVTALSSYGQSHVKLTSRYNFNLRPLRSLHMLVMQLIVLIVTVMDRLVPMTSSYYRFMVITGYLVPFPINKPGFKNLQFSANVLILAENCKFFEPRFI